MMQFTELIEKINTIFNPQALFTAARKTQFLKRTRQIVLLDFLLAFIETLGVQPKATIADIHRKYQAISQMPINYKPFHNQIKKLNVLNSLKISSKAQSKHGSSSRLN
jgi:hypothetical protein